MRRFFPALCALLLAGCASSSEVKHASSDVGLALAALDEAEENFRDVFLRELDATQELVARAIVADAVVRVVEGLSAEEIDGNLIVISTAIQSERLAYKDLTATVMRARPKAAETPADVVGRVLAVKAGDLRATADTLEALGSSQTATALRIRADELASGAAGIPQFGDMETLVILSVVKAVVRQGSKNLGAYLDLMRLVHAQVHEWITTDVTIRGDRVAALIDEHSATLGLAGPTGSDAGGAP